MTQQERTHLAKSKIINTAQDLFLSKGYDETSIQEIVKETGISKGTIFHHFATKEDILAAVLEAYNQNIAEHIKEWLENASPLNAKDKLTHIYNTFYIYAEYTPITNIAMQSKSHRIVIEDLRMWTNKITPLISDVIREGIVDGSINTLYPDQVAELFNLLFCIWADPVIIGCTEKELTTRLKFMQHTFKALGVDFIDQAFIDKSLDFAKDLYH